MIRVRSASSITAAFVLGLALWTGTSAQAGSRHTAEEIEIENAKIFLMTLPELERKIIHSKLERVQFNETKLSEMISPVDAEDPTKPIVILVQGEDFSAREKPELYYPLHLLLSQGAGAYFFKGEIPEYGTGSMRTNTDALWRAILWVTYQHRDRPIQVLGYGDGNELITRVRGRFDHDPKLSRLVRFNYASIWGTSGLRQTLLYLLGDLGPQRDEDRAVYRCRRNGIELNFEIGYYDPIYKSFDGLEYKGYAHAFHERKSYYLTKVTPYRNDPNYLYMTLSEQDLATNLAQQRSKGISGTHLIAINTANPRTDSWYWPNFYAQAHVGSRAVAATPPQSLNLECVQEQR